MSRPSPDTAFRPARGHAHDLSSPQLRALRKELLIVRASVERAEIAGALTELRENVTRFKWLRFVMPAFGASRSRSRAFPLFSNLLSQYPVLGSLASLLVTKPLRGRVLSAARPFLKWGGLAFTAWEAWRVYQQVRQQTRREARDPASSPTSQAAHDD